MLRARFSHLIMTHAWSGYRTPTGGVPSGRANHYTTAPLLLACLPLSCFIANNRCRLINSQTSSGVTAAYLAAQQGNLEVLRYLVEEGGASLKLMSHDRRSCLQAAAQTGRLETIQWLVGSQIK